MLGQMMAPLAFVTLSLTAVVWLTQSLQFVDMIINRGLSASRFLYLTILLTPGFLALILPIALFCAILYTYHRLTYDSEIMVMRAAGLSQRALAVPALVMALVIVALSYLLSLYLVPLGFSTFKDLQFVIRNTQASVLLQAGEFNTLTNGVTAYVRERGADGDLRGILVHDSREPDRPVTVMAERGVLLAGETGPRFVLFEGNRQEIGLDRGELSLLYFERYALDLGVFDEALGTRWREPGERYLPSLLFPSNSEDDVAYSNELRAEGHNRIVSPLYGLVLAVIALGAALSGEVNRRGAWVRIAVAGGAVVVFEAIGMALVSVLAERPELTPILYLNVAAALALGFWVVRVRRWRVPLGGTPGPQSDPAS
ncbi:MAG: LPS export ABC transporter permease LptF [Alphaproteobacteria bacterium]|nr:LPS export ABC transporter permease LptF [Alphaproteobacteria bacterium]MBT5860945.1 LPS export ABC transporter permease LptF [Alphaproteobacteria bacterium]